MPAGNVTLNANFAENPRFNFSVTAEDGGDVSVIDGSNFAVGETVWATAIPNNGWYFTEWTIQGVTVASLHAPTISFAMPQGNVTAVANFSQTPPPERFALTVTAGTGGTVAAAHGIDFAENDNVWVSATEDNGWRFVNWTVNGVEISDVTAGMISFRMPSNAVELTANFVEVQRFAVTINHGGFGANISENPAAIGNTIIINAGTPPIAHSFAGWIVNSGNVELADATLQATTFIMPGGAVELTATWQPIPSLLPTLRVVDGFGYPSDEINVRLVLDNNPGFSSMVMRVNVPQGFTLVGYSLGDDFDEEEPTFFAPEIGATGHFYFGWVARPTNITTRGVLVNLTFRADEGVDGRFPIEVLFENSLSGNAEIPTNATGDELAIAISNGKIHATSTWILGDLTGTDAVTSADANALARYLVGQIVGIDLRAADFFGNGNVGLANIIHLSRALVGHHPLDPNDA
jgi:hypothetical protein